MNRRKQERRESTRTLFEVIDRAEIAVLKRSLYESERELKEAHDLIAKIGAQIVLPANLADEVDKILPKI